MAVTATMMVGVMRLLRAASSSAMPHHRSPTSGICSTTTVANAAQRKSSTRTADKTWPVSTCRERYQEHADDRQLFSFLVAPPRDWRVVSRSLATLVLIQFRFRFQRAPLIRHPHARLARARRAVPR